MDKVIWVIKSIGKSCVAKIDWVILCQVLRDEETGKMGTNKKQWEVNMYKYTAPSIYYDSWGPGGATVL